VREGQTIKPQDAGERRELGRVNLEKTEARKIYRDKEQEVKKETGGS